MSIEDDTQLLAENVVADQQLDIPAGQPPTAADVIRTMQAIRDGVERLPLPMTKNQKADAIVATATEVETQASEPTIDSRLIRHDRVIFAMKNRRQTMQYNRQRMRQLLRTKLSQD